VTVWGVIPAAGRGTRIQPLACSKELLPVGARDHAGGERPRAISEYLLDRMLVAGVQRICLVIAPGKSDIMEYFRDAYEGVPICYAVQPRAAGLCDALFRALPLVDPNDDVCVGLPDTLWFPAEGLAQLPERRFSFLLFPVQEPARFDAVVTDASDRVREVQVKQPLPSTPWIWGAFRLPGATLLALETLWHARACEDEYFGTLVNAHLREGGDVLGVRAGQHYVDVGTLSGYREAARMLAAPCVEEVAR
jgi:glucose-1-phosphate thymidylyltransferase